MTPKKESALPPAIFLALCALCLLPWLAVQATLSINGDAAWLMTAAMRLLDGGTMSAAFFEVNPPLSILYHAPPVFVTRLTGLDAAYVLFSYFLCLIVLSACAVNGLLKSWDFLKAGHRQALIAAWLAANTIIVTIAIGQRDHIVILGLLPFMVAQLGMTWGYRIPPRLLWPVLACGAAAVLVKPHYGLLPALLLLHRMIAHKRFFSMIRDRDFIFLACGTICYIACVRLFFPDYIDVILPDVLDLYAGQKDYAAALPELIIYGFIFLLFPLIDSVMNPARGRTRQLLFMFYGGAVACLVPYAVQMKGFYYQMVPALALFYCAIGLSLYCHAARLPQRFTRAAALMPMLIFALAYLNRPPLWAYPTHKDYASLPLSQIIRSCEAPCTFFIFHDSTEIMHPTAFYAGSQNASRFPTFWFLPPLLNSENTAAKDKFAEMVAQDMEIFGPDLLLIGRYQLRPDAAYFDFAGFFDENDRFATAWRSYEWVETTTFNRRPYFAGTALDFDYDLTFDIYRKKGPDAANTRR